MILNSSFRFLFAGWLLASPVSGMAKDIEDCKKEASALGKTSSFRSLSLECSKTFFAKASLNQLATSPSGILSVATLENTISLYDNKKGQFQYISGSNTGLHLIESVSLSSLNKEVWVLNQDPEGKKEILVFITNYGGNLIPLRRYEDPELKEAKRIQVSQDGKKVAVLFSKNKIRIFSTTIEKTDRLSNLKCRFNQDVQIPSSDTTDHFIWLSDSNRFAFSFKGKKNELTTFEIEDTGKEAKLLQVHSISKNPSGIKSFFLSKKPKGLLAVYGDGSNQLIKNAMKEPSAVSEPSAVDSSAEVLSPEKPQ